MYKQFLAASVLCVSCLMGGEFEMRLSEEEKKLIEEIITFLEEVEEEEFLKTTEQMAPKIMKMMAVSPFQILAHIASERDLRENLLHTSESPVKWNVVVKGISMRMNQETLSPQFAEKMEDFMRYLSLEGNEVKGYIEKKEWGSFIIALLNSIEA
jgi:hypothetical protein